MCKILKFTKRFFYCFSAIILAKQWSISNLQASTIATEKPSLIFNMQDEAKLPKKFRTTLDSFIETDQKLPTREGFDELNLSGSGQFSDLSLGLLLEKIHHPKNFYLIDLRQESHGFINGSAVSWYGIRDWYNVGKTQHKINQSEKEALNLLLKQKTIQVGQLISKDEQGFSLPLTKLITLKVTDVKTESQLAEKHHIHYRRFSITDHVKPSDDIVDQFVEFITTLPSDYWLHFHCSAGVGRTSTMMVMVDMMKNAKKVSLGEIYDRQKYLGGRDLRKLTDSPWKLSYIKDRVDFLNEFYTYCRTNNDHFQTSWTLYKLLKQSDKSS